MDIKDRVGDCGPAPLLLEGMYRASKNTSLIGDVEDTIGDAENVGFALCLVFDERLVFEERKNNHSLTMLPGNSRNAAVPAIAGQIPSTCPAIFRQFLLRLALS